ncbi:SIS domain-containing protein [Brevibacillus sp. B_LB10_24]|uniref:SIS domain-containing protein n=1 Tax=Brevibacillus sp. B_LB10_24 TaxID=3380645 RepID=UPI0038BD1AD1
MSSMLDTIERIPVQLTKILHRKDSLHGQLQAYLKAHSGIKKIVFVASGTSFNAAFTTKNFAEEVTRLPVELIYPNIFVHYYNRSLWSRDHLYIFISQGGKTKLVHEALRIVKEKGIPNISITESLDSPIAALADAAIEMGSENEEFMFRTLGYSATCATLYWLFAALAKIKGLLPVHEEQKLMEDYVQMVNHLPKIKSDTLQWYREHKFMLMRKHTFIFSGTNDLWPVAQEADIKFMEMLPVFTNSFELEELIHGPQNAFDQTTGYFLLSRKNEDANKVQKIAEFINTEIAPCIVVGEGASGVHDFAFQPAGKSFSSLEYITFFQTLAYLLASDRGRDLTKTMYPQIVNYINKSITP